MRHYTWRTLFQGRGRAALSIGGVALALVLIIALDAVFLGAERQSTRYIDHAGADIIVSQAGVRTMHMAASTIPLTTIEPTRAVPGVASVTPVLFASDIMRLGDTRASVYVIGLAADATSGLPPTTVAGQAMPEPGGAVIDEVVAHRAGLHLGDTVTILGRPFRLDGLSAGTAGLVNSVVVISLPDFAAIWGSAQNASFLFVTVTPGTSANDVATRIEAAVDGVTVQTRGAFAAEERALIRDMGTSIILVMNLLGFLIGLAIMALTVYLAMLARRAEFGMLKAVGASNRALYRVVMLQALASVVVGVIVAIMVTLALSVLLPRLGSNVTLAVGGTSLVKALVASLIIAGLAAGLPIKRIAGLDPAAVFRGG
jgi:putative ABC transport system permease protein